MGPNIARIQAQADLEMRKISRLVEIDIERQIENQVDDSIEAQAEINRFRSRNGLPPI